MGLVRGHQHTQSLPAFFFFFFFFLDTILPSRHLSTARPQAVQGPKNNTGPSALPTGDHWTRSITARRMTCSVPVSDLRQPAAIPFAGSARVTDGTRHTSTVYPSPAAPRMSSSASPADPLHRTSVDPHGRARRGHRVPQGNVRLAGLPIRTRRPPRHPLDESSPSILRTPPARDSGVTWRTSADPGNVTVNVPLAQGPG